MDQRPAVSVARHHEARCHILAQQRDILGMQAVANGQGAAGVVAARRIGKRGVGAEADAREINAAHSATIRMRGRSSHMTFQMPYWSFALRLDVLNHTELDTPSIGQG